MRSPKCQVFPQSARYPKKVVRALRYDGEVLVIDIQGKGFSFARVVFRDVVGFRVLDERDLCEFWNTYAEPVGWLYEMEEGGWLELESQRKLFNSPDCFPDLREYLLVDDKCVNVLTRELPEIQDVGTDPTQNS
jgi:hypothetical protein